MKYFAENKVLLIKYLFILISNILLFILCNFYLKDYIYKDLILLFLVLIMDLIIYYYKERKEFKFYLDFLLSIFLGLALAIFIKDKNIYGQGLISIIFSNNIIFTRSRLSNKFLKKSLQYLLIVIFMLLEMFINVAIYLLIW